MAENPDPETSHVPEAFLAECRKLWAIASELSTEAYASKLSALEAAAGAARREAEQLQEQVEPLQRTRESQARSLVDLDKKIKELQNALNAEREQNAAVRGKFEERAQETKSALENVARVETRLQESEVQILAEAEKRQAAEKRAAELEQDMQQHVEAAVGEVRAELNKVSSKLDVITAERDRLNRDLADAFETIATLEERVKQSSAQDTGVGAAQRRIADLEAEIDVLKRKNERLNQECDEFAQKNAELLKRLSAPAST